MTTQRNSVSGSLTGELYGALREFFLGTQRCRRSGDELLLHEPETTSVDGIRSPESGVQATLNRLKASASSALRERGLYQSQVERLSEILQDAQRLEQSVRRPIHSLRAVVAILMLAFVAVIPYTLLRVYGWHDSDLKQASNLAQFLDAVAGFILLIASAFIAAALLDLRIRTRVAMSQIQRCRVLIQVVDSHVLSNHETLRQVLKPRAQGAGNPAEAAARAEAEVEYLLFAGSLVRIAAKAAVLYGQWLPRDSIVQEADLLSQLSIAIEQSCLFKAQAAAKVSEQLRTQ